MAQASAASVLDDGRRVRVAWADGEARDFPSRWLFDHADEARDPVSGQRRHGALALEKAAATAARVDGDQLVLEFACGRRRIALRRLRDEARGNARRELWATPELIAGCAPIAFDAYLADDATLARALGRVARGGLAVLAGAGEAPDAVQKAVARFGFVRETNYGRLFDVRVEAEPGNFAYTERALDLHTDNPYRDPAPSLQLLHAIRADAAGGGATLFVDGFAHAEALRRDAPDAFAILAREPVRFTFTDAAGSRWSARASVLQLDAAGELMAVRLNHRALDLEPAAAEQLDAWYDAYLAFHRRLHAPAAAYARRLAPGEMVIFDNRRILHGRAAFDRTGARWLRGAYADVDGLNATLARLTTPQALASPSSRSA